MDLSAEGRALVAAVTGGLLPASVRVPAREVSLHCLVWGRQGDPTAVLLHGNGGHAHWWDALVPALVPGWRLVVPDLRGHGQSDHAEPPSYRLEDYAVDLTAVLGALAPGRVVLAGHSMGGRVVTAYAAHHPERVRGLAILDSRLTDIDPASAARWRGRAAGKREGRGHPTREAALAAFRFVPKEPDVPAAVVADLAHHAVVERAPGDWTYRFDRAVLAPEGDGAGNLDAVVRAIRCPTLVLAGERSWVMDAAQVASVAKALSATARVFPGGHHFLLVRPAEVGKALRTFLDGLPR